MTNPDINGGTIDGATIATSDITVGSEKTLDVSQGHLLLRMIKSAVIRLKEELSTQLLSIHSQQQK